MLTKIPKSHRVIPLHRHLLVARGLPAWVYAKPEPLTYAAEPQAQVDLTEDLLTRAEVVRYLRVSDRTVSRLICKGKLPAARIGRAVRIRQSDLPEMLNGKPKISAV